MLLRATAVLSSLLVQAAGLSTTTALAQCSALPTNSYSSASSRAVGYFVNWSIYGRNYQPQDIPAASLTHLLYSFAAVNSTGGVYLTDVYADVQKRYQSDSWTETGNNVYGCVKQLYLLKKQNRNLKTLLSIGGWTYSGQFAAPLATPAGRRQFVASAVMLLQDLGFDGLDIDYEYPLDASSAADFAALVQELRVALDEYAVHIGYPRGAFLITVASPAGPSHYGVLDLPGMAASVDFWNLMAYDYAGSFSNVTGCSANYFPSIKDPLSTPFNTRQALEYYNLHGISLAKINLGIPLYGRAFIGTQGLGMPFSGVGNGSWEAGVYDWKDLPLPGSVGTVDSSLLASWSWDASKQMLVSYDNMQVMHAKARKATEVGLGGLMWWELSADRKGTGSAVAAQVAILAEKGIEQRINVLEYPHSQYSNLKAGFPYG